MKKYITLALMILGIIVSTVISSVSAIYSAMLSPKSFIFGSISSDPNQPMASKVWFGVAVLFLIVSLLVHDETKKRFKQLKC